MKIVTFLALISTCSAGVLPRVFYADEHLLNSEFETTNVGKVKDNCVNRIKWREWKSNGGLNSIRKDGPNKPNVNESGTQEKNWGQQADQFRNSSQRIKVLEESEILSEKFNKRSKIEARELLGVESLNQSINELEFPKKDSSERFGTNSLESSEVTNVINLGAESNDSIRDVSDVSFRRIGDKVIETLTEIQKEENAELTDSQNPNISELGILENDQNKILHSNYQESDATHLINPHEVSEPIDTSSNESSILDGLNLTDSLSLGFVTENTSSFESLGVDKNELRRGEIGLVQKTEEVSEPINGSSNASNISDVLNLTDTLNIDFVTKIESSSEFLSIEEKYLTSQGREIGLVQDVEEVSEQIDISSNSSNILGILNLTDTLSIQFVTENISSIESLSVDENKLMSQGVEIALFQDESTNGFEFLIDSETTKNLILTELIDSQSFVETEDDLTSFIIDGPAGSGPETVDFDLVEENDSVETNITIGMNNIETVSMKDSFNLNNDLNSLEKQNHEINGTNSANDLVTITSIIDLPANTMECPRPGVCIFWFMAQDKCTDSSQCKGSSICCKIRCSKTCIDI